MKKLKKMQNTLIQEKKNEHLLLNRAVYCLDVQKIIKNAKS